jgi:hypothetical protein
MSLSKDCDGGQEGAGSALTEELGEAPGRADIVVGQFDSGPLPVTGPPLGKIGGRHACAPAALAGTRMG